MELLLRETGSALVEDLDDLGACTLSVFSCVSLEPSISFYSRAMVARERLGACLHLLILHKVTCARVLLGYTRVLLVYG